jgi:DNA-binding winged helix-turn-helix (wHTH) protein/tetratricopeptide (TPR) repeat protein/TolB-like protein
MTGRHVEVTNEKRKFHEIAASETRRRLAFDCFVLDPEAGGLLKNGRPVPLAPKPFETLLLLASRTPRLVSKSELMEALWPGTFVTEDVLVQCIVEIRRVLGDSAREPRFVATVPRRGYRFLAEVVVLPEEALAAAPSRAAGDAAVASAQRLRRRRLAKVAAGAAAAAGLLGGGLWLTARGARALPGPAPITPGSVLVLPVRIEAATEETGWLRDGLAEILRADLEQLPGLSLLPRHRVREALAEVSPDAAPTAGEAVEIARRLGAEQAIAGSLVRIDERFVLTAERIDSRSGQAMDSVSVRGRFPDEILTAVDELAAGLGTQMGVAGGEAPGGSRPQQLATRSVEAYRAYVEARHWFARGGSRGAEEAERRLDEAVRLDPEFAYAYLLKAEIQEWRRRLGYGQADPTPALRAAAALADHLPERERLLVEAMQATRLGGDAREALDRLERLLRLHPGFAAEVGVPRLIADIHYAAGRWDDLILLGEAHAESPALPARERAVVSMLLAKAFRQKGEPDRALRYAQRAVRLWPEREGPAFLRQRTDLGRLLLDAGRPEEAVAEFQGVSQAGEADVTNLTDAGWGLYMSGRRELAERLARRAVGLDSRYGNAHHLLGWLQLAAGRPAPAALSFERAFERTPSTFGAVHLGFVSGDIAALYYSGVSLRKSGNEKGARAAFERVARACLESLDRGGLTPTAAWEAQSFIALAQARLGAATPDLPRLPGDDATFFLQSARLDAVRGRPDAALRSLRQALALAPSERQHVADDPNFDPLRENAEFRALTTAEPRRRASR